MLHYVYKKIIGAGGFFFSVSGQQVCYMCTPAVTYYQQGKMQLHNIYSNWSQKQ